MTFQSVRVAIGVLLSSHCMAMNCHGAVIGIEWSQFVSASVEDLFEDGEGDGITSSTTFVGETLSVSPTLVFFNNVMTPTSTSTTSFELAPGTNNEILTIGGFGSGSTDPLTGNLSSDAQGSFELIFSVVDQPKTLEFSFESTSTFSNPPFSSQDKSTFDYFLRAVGPATTLVDERRGTSDSAELSDGFTLDLDPGENYRFGFFADARSGTTDIMIDWSFSGTFTPVEVEFVWTNAMGGTFAEGGNWDQNVAPDDASHTAIFDLDSTYAVNLDATAQTGVTRVSRGDVTMNLSGNNYNVADTLIVGDIAGQSATLRIPELNGLVANDIVVGEVDGADGLLILGPDSTSGSSLTMAASAQGGAGSGTGDDPPLIAEKVTIKPGSQVKISGGSMQIAEIIAESSLQPTPIAYPTSLVIEGSNDSSGPTLITGKLAIMSNGDEAGVLGSVASGLVMGPNRTVVEATTVLVGGAAATRLTSVALTGNSKLAVGTRVAPSQVGMIMSPDGGVTILEVKDHSSIEIGPLAETIVGDQGKGTLTLRGFAQFNADGTPMVVAKAGMGMVMLSDNSEATVGMIDVGREPGSMGMVSVMSDQGTAMLAADQINVAVEGQGTLEVMDGGVANVTGEINVSDPGSGDVMPLFGAGTNHGILAGGGDTGAASGAFSYGPGTLRVEGTGIVTADVINIGDNGQLTGTGTVQTTNGLNISNLLKPGASPGVLNIIGPVHLASSGVVEIEIAGTTPGIEHDVLNIVGDSDFDGLFTFIFDGYSPQQGDTFEFLMADGQTDLTNVNYEVRNLLPGFEFEVSLTDDGFQMLALNNGTFVPEPGTLVLASLCLFAVLASPRTKPMRHAR
jgi:T5SS/PEP-CTERM-associated repeat protein